MDTIIKEITELRPELMRKIGQLEKARFYELPEQTRFVKANQQYGL
ncbi:MAG: hypothetical protein LBK58_07410 [Prevotellaceae bacterium]|jgi:hypothetical protein|nr:hypothetical protein [Prevotellaceae bacterium]